MEEGRQDNPISTHEYSQDLERDLCDQNQTNNSQSRSVAVWIAKIGIIILLLCVAAPIAGVAFFAIIFTGAAPEVVNAVVIFGVVLFVVVLAICGSRKWGFAIGVVALLGLVVAMNSFFG